MYIPNLRSSADLADFVCEIQQSLKQIINIKLSYLKEAIAYGWGENTHAAQCAALGKGLHFHGSDFQIDRAVSRFSALCRYSDPYLAELLRARLLGYGFNISVKRSPKEQRNRYSDTAYAINISLSPSCIHGADPVSFIVPTGFKNDVASIQIGASYLVKVNSRFAVTDGRSRNLISTRFVDDSWEGSLFLHYWNDSRSDVDSDTESRCVKSVKAALARASIASNGPWVRCVIYKPDSYDVGAWRVELSLGPEAIKIFEGRDFVFSLPQELNRRVMPDDGYLANIDPEKRIFDGKIVNGVWFGNLYTNGVEEHENPTLILFMYRRFIEGVSKALCC